MNDTQKEAIAQADAQANNAGLPTYTQLLAVLAGTVEALALAQKNSIDRVDWSGDTRMRAACQAIGSATGKVVLDPFDARQAISDLTT